MNLFDGLKATVFRTTTSVMGYVCSWLPSEGGDEQTALVHYKAPALESELSELGSGVNQLGFMPITHSIEYLVGSFPALMDSVRNGVSEYLTVTQQNSGETIGIFKVREVNPLHDGDTFFADLVPVEEIPDTEPTDIEYTP